MQLVKFYVEKLCSWTKCIPPTLTKNPPRDAMCEHELISKQIIWEIEDKYYLFLHEFKLRENIELNNKKKEDKLWQKTINPANLCHLFRSSQENIAIKIVGFRRRSQNLNLFSFANLKTHNNSWTKQWKRQTSIIWGLHNTEKKK